MSGPTTIATSLSGRDLLDKPLLNKGTAFTKEERTALGLTGLLPPHIETLEGQTSRAYAAFRAEPTDLDRHIYLRNLQDANETLYYRLMLKHTAEMMPIVYTPVVGLACQKFSHIYRRPRGVFVAYPERNRMDEILGNVKQNVRAIVVTDGERVLGLGDQGAGGMGIPIGKLSLYSLIGGVNPALTLPVLLDLGTNNGDLLDDPFYIGWRHERVKGQAYDNFVDQFVEAVMRRWPNVLLQWEDFASVDAARFLERYRDRLCTFNDDIQGTATVLTGTLLAAMAATGIPLARHRTVMLGAGSAGLGITRQLVQALVAEGIREAEARKSIFVVDVNGLLHDGRSDLGEFHKPLAQSRSDLSAWDCDFAGPVTLADVVRNVRPTALVGATGQPGAFPQSVVAEMAAHTDRPVIFPLSNPTDRAEATPSDLIRWTDGRALIATGSPFHPVEYNGVTHRVAQSNNSYVFPGDRSWACSRSGRPARDRGDVHGRGDGAARNLTLCCQAGGDPSAPPCCRPSTTSARRPGISPSQLAGWPRSKGLAEKTSSDELERRVNETMWVPEYPKTWFRRQSRTQNVQKEDNASSRLHRQSVSTSAAGCGRRASITISQCPGTTTLSCLTSFLKQPDLQLISCCNELNAAYAADGYARATGGPAAVVVTFSVGALSALNGIAGAYAEWLPVVI